MIEASELPHEEKVYLEKDFMGWRVVEPVRDPITKEINWFNLLVGGKKGMMLLSVIILIAVGLYLGVNELISSYKFIAENPCLYCSDCASTVSNFLKR